MKPVCSHWVNKLEVFLQQQQHRRGVQSAETMQQTFVVVVSRTYMNGTNMVLRQGETDAKNEIKVVVSA